MCRGFNSLPDHHRQTARFGRQLVGGSTDSQHPQSCTRFEDDRIFAAASTEADGPVVQFG